jgi:hypothetical protein
MLQVKFPEKTPNKCVVGDVTNVDIWKRTAGDLVLIKMIKERVKVNIVMMTYSRNATFASLLDIYKRIAVGKEGTKLDTRSAKYKRDGDQKNKTFPNISWTS